MRITECICLLFFSLVSPPLITVAVNPAVDHIYSSTAVNLTCTAVLAEEVDTVTMATATWTGSLGQQPTDSDRISVTPAINVTERTFESVLVFYPVDFKEDNGSHTCKMTISSNTMDSLQDSLIEDNSNTSNTTIIVKG